ncbi:MAG TPA: Ig-like domain-containing protein [Longimicrobium sp.]
MIPPRASLPKLLAVGLLWLSACESPSGPGAPTAVQPLSGSGQRVAAGAALAEPLVVRVTGSGGRPVPGVSVTWTAGPDAGIVTPLAAETDADGRASATWTVGTTVGERSVTAAVAGLAPATFTATVVPGAPATMIALIGNGQFGRVGELLTEQLTVQVTDEHGNPVPDAEVRWEVTAGGGSATPAASRTSATGTASTRWTLGTLVGRQNLTASVGAVSAPFVAVANFSPTLSVVSPAPSGSGGERRVDDPFPLVVFATSGREVVRVTATIAGRATSLASTADGSGRWQGSVSVAGLARGPAELTLASTDAGGTVQTVTVPVFVDRRPVLTVTAPLFGAVARPSVRLVASCQDDDPGGCIVRVRTQTFPGTSGGTQLAEARNQLDATVTLPLGTSYLLFMAVDSAGQTAGENRTIHSEDSPRWTEVASAGWMAWQVGADRILFADSTATSMALRVRSRATGAETVLFQQAGRKLRQGFLTPRGAIFVSVAPNNDPLQERVLEVRDGTVLDLGRVSQTSLRVVGRWAIWYDGARLVRRDLETGTSLQVTDAAAADLAANGDVVYGTSPGYEIFRFRNGTSTQLTRDDDAVLWNVSPVTDGINVLYNKRTPCCTAQTSQVALFGASGEVLLTPRTASVVDYQANGGWAAYLEPGPTGVPQVWLRSPAGAETQVTTAGSASRLQLLGPNGELVFTTGNRRYAALPGRAPVDIGLAWGEYTQRVFWVNGELYAVLGRSAFRIQL